VGGGTSRWQCHRGNFYTFLPLQKTIKLPKQRFLAVFALFGRFPRVLSSPRPPKRTKTSDLDVILDAQIQGVWSSELGYSAVLSNAEVPNAESCLSRWRHQKSSRLFDPQRAVPQEILLEVLASKLPESVVGRTADHFRFNPHPRTDLLIRNCLTGSQAKSRGIPPY